MTRKSRSQPKSVKSRKKKNTINIKEYADKVIFYKGLPWSVVEFDKAFYETIKKLEKLGATKKQIEKFKKLVWDAPTKGGKFNPYSGD